MPSRQPPVHTAASGYRRERGTVNAYRTHTADWPQTLPCVSVYARNPVTEPGRGRLRFLRRSMALRRFGPYSPGAAASLAALEAARRASTASRWAM